MPFEFRNPHKCVITCTLPAPHGQFRVAPGDYVPTPEQEQSGIVPNLLRPHVAPSFLQKTPGHIRRRLRLESDQKTCADQVPAVATPAVASQPVVEPTLVDSPPVVAGDVQEPREAAPVASTPEVSVPAGDAAQAAPGAPSDAGEGTPVLTNEPVTADLPAKVILDDLTVRKEAEVKAPASFSLPDAAPAAVPPSTPPEAPRSFVSPRKLEEEGTMSTAKSIRALEEHVDRRSSSAGSKEGKRLR